MKKAGIIIDGVGDMATVIVVGVVMAHIIIGVSYYF